MSAYVCGTIRTLRITRRERQLKFYKVIAVPVLLYGSESWVLKKKDESLIQGGAMKFLRAVRGVTRLEQIPKSYCYTWNYGLSQT